MAKCKRCGIVGKSRKAKNWQNWQLCYKCAIILHPEVYAKERKHGTGYRYPKETKYADLMDKPLLWIPTR